MGTYLYGIRKLKKPRTLTREDGRTITVAHKLVYRLKISFYNKRPERLAINSLKNQYNTQFTGPVLFHNTIYLWNGIPYWYDSTSLKQEEWGTIIEGKAEVPPMKGTDQKFWRVHYFNQSTVRAVMVNGVMECTDQKFWRVHYFNQSTVRAVMVNGVMECRGRVHYFNQSTVRAVMVNGVMECRGGPEVMKKENPTPEEAEALWQMYSAMCHDLYLMKNV